MAIPINCKRLVEVDFPLVSVSTFSTKEKNIARGSFGAVHPWWARRPLAACRAMNLATMLPDPADKNCPIKIRSIIAEALDKFEVAPGRQLKINHTMKNVGDLSVSRN